MSKNLKGINEIEDIRGQIEIMMDNIEYWIIKIREKLRSTIKR